ncbi:hypothetical protein ACFOW4_07300 [Micromonospora sp. GCM10011542]|uniref:hypothetical protein n=1 Tax=Micromonospora sp. GCM10011542 TaxID=3317337 RepID=UPI00361CCBB7
MGLYFTEKPASNAHFTLTGPGGSRVDNGWSYGEPTRLDKPVQEYFMVDGVFEPRLYHTGFPAVVSVAHWPAKGRYTASYLSVASDGEPVRGEVTFDYQGPTTAAPAGWAAPTDGPAPTLLALVDGATPSASAAAGVTDARTVTPAAATPAVNAERRLPPWVVPVLVVAVVGAIVVVAARRTPAPGRGGTARRPGGARPGGVAGREVRRGRR